MFLEADGRLVFSKHHEEQVMDVEIKFDKDSRLCRHDIILTSLIGIPNISQMNLIEETVAVIGLVVGQVKS